MSAYTSLTISKAKALELVAQAMQKDDDLKMMLNAVLEKHTLFNCYRIVGRDEENEDDRLSGPLGFRHE